MSDLADSTLSKLVGYSGGNDEKDVHKKDRPRSTNYLVPGPQGASSGQATLPSPSSSSPQPKPSLSRPQMGRSKSAERRSLGSYENTIIFQPITSPPNEFDTKDSGLIGLLENNQQWAKAIHAERPQFFHDIALKQEPKLLWIGCSDSRVPANQIVHLGPGEVFVHRNIANLVIHTDLNCLSVLQYAIEVLKVEHVVVCGHYRCGGVSASMHKHQHGLIDNWLRNIKDVYQANRDELVAIKDDDARERRLVELNVENSARNVAHSTIVQNAWKSNQRVLIHSWVYDLETGFINSLPLCIQTPTLLEDIYSYH